jgi:hypothetical protein
VLPWPALLGRQEEEIRVVVKEEVRSEVKEEVRSEVEAEVRTQVEEELAIPQGRRPLWARDGQETGSRSCFSVMLRIIIETRIIGEFDGWSGQYAVSPGEWTGLAPE